MAMRLSVIIPSYNEQKNLKRKVLLPLLTYLQGQSYSWELLLSDDGSTDGTTDALRQFAKQDERIRLLANIHAGKAPTVTAGMLAAKGEWRLFADFDQSTPIAELEKLWPWTKDGFEVVIGSREIQGAIRDVEPWYRHLMGRVFNIVVEMLTMLGVKDTQCGFKLFSGRATELLYRKLRVYGSQAIRKDAFTGAFDVELLYLAKKMKFPVKEVPIHWKHNPTDRVSPIRDSLRMFRDVFKIKITDWLKGYEE
ncbi:glycosyltransferase [Candidatus Woesebacteria bacterium]|nr:glycosyltransferase [Candidatus Woesebacteria bacterium]